MRTINVILSALLLVACGGDDGHDDHDHDVDAAPDAAPREVVDETRTLAPGDIAEGEWVAGPDDRIVIHLEAANPFGWNIHGHIDGHTETIVEHLEVTEGDHDFVPPGQENWFLLVANRGEADVELTVHMELYGAATFEGWGN